MTLLGVDKFNADLEKFELATYKQFETMLRAIGIEMLSRLVFKTPVDKGRARGNWQVSIDDAIKDTVKDTDRAGGSTIAKGLSVLTVLKDHGIGHVIYMTNNVEYIIDLEEGSSQKAPHGMVAITLAELQQMFG